MTADRVDAVIASIEPHDPELAGWMRTAAGGLTAGEGEETIDQASLQEFLWYRLPAKYPEDAWHPTAEAAAVLLSLLGLDRYAAIARSTTTKSILDAWEESSSRGFARFRAARAASGVHPPDTDLLEWGSLMGMEEVAALGSVELALEKAIVDGELTPGSRGWQKVAEAVCARVLASPPHANLPWISEPKPTTMLAAVHQERADDWVRSGRPEALRAWRERARAFAAPEVQPSDVADAVAPMQWLIDACTGGLTLTQAGYLPPALVREGAARFGWWDWRVQPRSEADVFMLGQLRETATRLRLTARRARRLAPTRRGLALAADPVGLWRLIAETIGCAEPYLATLSELAAHRLLEGPAVGDALERAVGPIIEAQGWRASSERGGSEPVTAEHAGHAVHRALASWDLFGLLDIVESKWKDGQQVTERSVALTAVGRLTAIAFLRARAIAPRADFHS